MQRLDRGVLIGPLRHINACFSELFINRFLGSRLRCRKEGCKILDAHPDTMTLRTETPIFAFGRSDYKFKDAISIIVPEYLTLSL